MLTQGYHPIRERVVPDWPVLWGQLPCARSFATLMSDTIPSIQTITPPRHRRRRIGPAILFNVVIPLALLSLGAFIVYSLGTVQPEKRPDADTTRVGRLKSLPPVQVVKLQSLESLGRPLRLKVDGTVVPYREALVAAEVAGRVVFKADDVEAGSYVNQGQLLMRIDPTDYELEVQRLTRLQEQEYQALAEIDQEMANAQRLIEVATADVALQQREVDRQRSLPEGFASRAEIDQANRALLAARQQLVNSQNQLDLLRQRRIRLEATERLAATQLSAAKVNLERTEIRAPIDGVIVSEQADLNTFVNRGSTLVTIEDTSKVEVATSLRMDQLYWVLDQRDRGAAPIDAATSGYDLPATPAIIRYEVAGREGLVYRWQGRLLRYDGIGLDPVTRTVPVRVVVDDPTLFIDERGQTRRANGATPLVRGMYVSVHLLIEPTTELVAIPARALQPGNRVLQFVPDESVLEVAAALPESGPLDPSVPPATAPPASASFEPSHWEPGRIIVRKDIYPVDSLVMEEGPMEDPDRIWICEVRDQLLSSGSLVVVSPIGSIDAGGMPARAERVAGMQVAPLPESSSGDSSITVARRGEAEEGI